ncbi:MAG TPA: energy transducer TonB [Blastocatellia bacterium]|nr:energy transducer TonB [Blastocatellia bacterium]
MTLGGHPALELKVSASNKQIIRSVFVIAGQRTYQAIILMPPDEGLPQPIVEFHDKVATKYLGSFKLISEADAAKTSDTPDASQPKPGYLPVSGGVLQGQSRKRVQPAYPPDARAGGVAGEVRVQITVSEEGKVIEATAVSGPELLREAALEAAKQWLFEAPKLSGTPVRMRGVLTFRFTLK